MKRIAGIIAAVIIWAIVLGAIYLFITSGNPGPNQLRGTADSSGKISGFWRGVLHGVKIVPNTVRLIFTDLCLYEPHNNGRNYNLGFGLGSLLSIVVLVIFVVIMWMFCMYLIHGSPIG